MGSRFPCEGQVWGEMGGQIVGKYWVSPCGELCKTAKPIEMPFVMWTRLGPRKHCIRLGCKLRIRLNRPYATAMRPYVKLLWPLVNIVMHSVAVWPGGNRVEHITEVTVHWTKLVLRCVTIRRYTVSVCNQPLRPTQPPILGRMGNECHTRGDDNAVQLGR